MLQDIWMSTPGKVTQYQGQRIWNKISSLNWCCLDMPRTFKLLGKFWHRDLCNSQDPWDHLLAWPEFSLEKRWRAWSLKSNRIFRRFLTAQNLKIAAPPLPVRLSNRRGHEQSVSTSWISRILKEWLMDGWSHTMATLKSLGLYPVLFSNRDFTRDFTNSLNELDSKVPPCCLLPDFRLRWLTTSTETYERDKNETQKTKTMLSVLVQ